MPRNALLVEFEEDDVLWAVEQNRYQCLIVRAIQRKLPEALFVTADKEHIAFSLPDDGPDGVRYTFDTEARIVENVIKPFDEHKIRTLADIPADYRSFSIVARESRPMTHRDPNVSNRERAEKRSAQRKSRRGGTRSSSATVRTYNRFLDSSAEDGDD